MFFSQAHLTVSALAALSAISGVAAHGYFSSPPVRGIEKASYNVDALKSPNRSGAVCRGEGPGTITPVGQSVTLGFTITAPHVGPCTVYILDPDLTNQRQIAQKNNCAAPGQVGPWTITIPSDITGHKVIRWFWEAEHVTPHEMYENCADVQIGGGGSGGDIPAPEATPTPKPKTGTDPAPAPAPASPAPAPAPASPPPSAPSTGGNDGSDSPAGSDGSGCQPGQYTCGPDGRLGQCSYGKYVWIRCATGTTCHGSGSSVYCARSA